MWRILSSPARLCDRVSRRDLLRLGTLGGLAALAPKADSYARPQAAGFGRARRCLLLFLTGGPPQHDTFDPKPDAPAGIRGELRPIATRTTGLRFTELFPRLAGQTDKLCVVRSVTHADTVHTSAGYTMLTGAYHPLANTPGGANNVRPTANDNPHLGSLLALTRSPRGGVPAFAALPEVIKDANVSEFPGQGAGFLGHRYDPFRVSAAPSSAVFEPPPIFLPPDMTAERLADRRLLNERLDHAWRRADRQPAGFAIHRDQAYALIGAPAVRRAFDLQMEPARVHNAYGPYLFGQGCLLARRLLEAGVTLVTVYWHYEGPDDSPVWDTHWNNFRHLRERLAAPTDQAVAALLDDLAARGLLDETLVICMGEFGRTPRINGMAGRDHWSKVQSILLAGAGMRGSRVYGASDRIGGEPADFRSRPPT